MIGMVLGPLAETNLRDALLSSNGDVSVLFGSSITIVLYVVLALVVGAAIYSRVRKKGTFEEHPETTSA